MARKWKSAGAHHLKPGQTYVFISNHRSYLDTATLFVYTGRRLGLLAKKEVLNVPILGVGMGFVNVMAIDRSNSERARVTVAAATERIRSGISFGVFAEGTRAKPGEFLPFKKGAFYMAAQAGVPIVPVAIKNTDYLMGKGTGEARSGTIEMVMLEPIPTTNCSTDEAVKQLVNRVHTIVGQGTWCVATPHSHAAKVYAEDSAGGLVSCFGVSGPSTSVIFTLARAGTKSV